MPALSSILIAALLWVASFAAVSGARAEPKTIADLSFTSIDGSAMPLGKYKGRVILIVNTASLCGYTPQYAGLQKLWQRYESEGLVVIGVPSNDFNQEPKSGTEIATFCQGAYGVTFPLTDKTTINGATAHPVYKWLNRRLGGNAEPRWNFHKYVVSADGVTVRSFATAIEPDDPAFIAAIETRLAEVALKK